MAVHCTDQCALFMLAWCELGTRIYPNTTNVFNMMCLLYFRYTSCAMMHLTSMINTMAEDWLRTPLKMVCVTT